MRLATLKSSQEGIEFVIEGANHSNAIFYLRVIAVVPARRNTFPCAQVNLIAQKSEVSSESFTELSLKPRDLADCAPSRRGTQCDGRYKNRE